MPPELDAAPELAPEDPPGLSGPSTLASAPLDDDPVTAPESPWELTAPELDDDEPVASSKGEVVATLALQAMAHNEIVTAGPRM